MKTKHRKQARAKHQQRFAANPTWLNTMVGMRNPLNESLQTDLAIPPRVAFEALRTGKGAEDDYHTLACAINLTAIRAEKMDELVQDVVIRAQTALVRMLERHQRIGRWGFDGTAIQDIPAALDIWEQVIALVDVRILMQDLLEVGRRLREGNVYDVTGLVTHEITADMKGVV